MHGPAFENEVRHMNKLQVQSQACPTGLSQARLINWGWPVTLTYIEIIVLIQPL